MSGIVALTAGTSQAPGQVFFRLGTGDRPAGGGGTFTHAITLGPSHINRKFYVMITSRTNSTTGTQYVTSCRITFNGVNYTGTKLVGPTSKATDPYAIYEIALPEGSGAATVVFTWSVGNPGYTGPVAYSVSAYEVTGAFKLVAATASGSTVTSNSTIGGVAMHQAYTPNASLPDGNYTASDYYYTTTGLSARGGRIYPTADGTVSATVSGAGRGLLVTVG